MKKYLFLFLMFIVYLCLLVKENTKSVINYDTNNTNSSFVFVDIYFENGVNSKTLSNEFKEYKNEYLVKKISVNNKLIALNCEFMDKCINYIYDANDNTFYDKYIASGFKIDKLTLIASKDYIISYLKNKDYLYKIY